MAFTTAARLWTLASACLLLSAHGVTITAKPGETVSLPCNTTRDTNIIVVEWIRPDLEPEYVFLYRDRKPVPNDQHPSFKNRVELKDGDMKDGDVSVSLNKVTRDDAGTYKCKIIQRGTGSRRKRAADTETIKSINLVVQTGHTAGHSEEGGDKEGGGKERGGKNLHVGLGVGLSAALLVVGVFGFLIYRRRRGATEQPPYEPANRPAEPPQV